MKEINNVPQEQGWGQWAYAKAKDKATEMGLKQAGIIGLRAIYSSVDGNGAAISSIASNAIAETTVGVTYRGERGAKHIANMLSKATVMSTAGYLAKESLNQVGTAAESYVSSTPLGAIAGKIANFAVINGGAVLAGAAAGVAYDRGTAIFQAMMNQIQTATRPS